MEIEETVVVSVPDPGVAVTVTADVTQALVPAAIAAVAGPGVDVIVTADVIRAQSPAAIADVPDPDAAVTATADVIRALVPAAIAAAAGPGADVTATADVIRAQALMAAADATDPDVTAIGPDADAAAPTQTDAAHADRFVFAAAAAGMNSAEEIFGPDIRKGTMPGSMTAGICP